MDISARIKYLLKTHHISQAELARKMNVLPSQVSHIVNSSQVPSVDTIQRICDCLRISLKDFFSEETKSVNLPIHVAQLMKACETLSIKEAAALQTIIDCFSTSQSSQASLPRQAPRIKRPLHFPQRNSATKQKALGQAAAGSPLFNDMSDDDVFVRVPSKYLDATRFGVVQAKGDSMMPDINDGDFVVVQKSTPPMPGGLALVRVDGSGEDEYVIKLFFKLQNTIELRSYNPDYTPQVYQFREVLAAEQIVSIIRADEA